MFGSFIDLKLLFTGAIPTNQAQDGIGALKDNEPTRESDSHSLITTLRPHTRKAIMLISLTVGKVDAGVAVLLTQDKRLVRGLCKDSVGCAHPKLIAMA